MLAKECTDDNYCQGGSFAITNEDTLVRAVALVLVQEYALARGIVTGEARTVEGERIVLNKDEIEDIVSRRLKPTVDYHRDGFLFQLMMWLAAHVDLDDGDLVALPHTQASAKGQDSIVVHRADGAVVALSICEDKVTENPRDTVREEVWPEIKDYEAGGRRDELRSNVIATLGLGGIPADEATALVRRISWEGKRRYRVRVTVQGKRTKRLFKGFDELVFGDVERRRGETVHLPELSGFSDWRLPTTDELKSLIKEGSKPSIDVNWFPCTVSSGYWSGTTHAYYTSHAWHVGFSNGSVSIYNKSNSHYVRAVRAGQ